MAQYPVLLSGTALTLNNAGAPSDILVAIVVLFIVTMPLIGPAFILLCGLQGRRLLGADEAMTLLAAVPGDTAAVARIPCSPERPPFGNQVLYPLSPRPNGHGRAACVRPKLAPLTCTGRHTWDQFVILGTDAAADAARYRR